MYSIISIFLKGLVALSLFLQPANVFHASRDSAPASVMKSMASGSRDGYYFEAKSFFHNNIKIIIVIHKSRQEIEKAYLKIPGTAPDVPGVKTLAYSQYWTKDGQDYCEIHLLDPQIMYQPEVMGHELMHCIYGNFHPTQTAGTSLYN